MLWQVGPPTLKNEISFSSIVVILLAVAAAQLSYAALNMIADVIKTVSSMSSSMNMAIISLLLLSLFIIHKDIKTPHYVLAVAACGFTVLAIAGLSIQMMEISLRSSENNFQKMLNLNGGALVPRQQLSVYEVGSHNTMKQRSGDKTGYAPHTKRQQHDIAQESTNTPKYPPLTHKEQSADTATGSLTFGYRGDDECGSTKVKCIQGSEDGASITMLDPQRY